MTKGTTWTSAVSSGGAYQSKHLNNILHQATEAGFDALTGFSNALRIDSVPRNEIKKHIEEVFYMRLIQGLGGNFRDIEDNIKSSQSIIRLAIESNAYLIREVRGKGSTPQGAAEDIIAAVEAVVTQTLGNDKGLGG